MIRSVLSAHIQLQQAAAPLGILSDSILDSKILNCHYILLSHVFAQFSVENVPFNHLYFRKIFFFYTVLPF